MLSASGECRSVDAISTDFLYSSLRSLQGKLQRLMSAITLLTALFTLMVGPVNTNSVNDMIFAGYFHAVVCVNCWACWYHDNEAKLKRTIMVFIPGLKTLQTISWIWTITRFFLFFFLCRTQAASHWTIRAMVSEGEAVFGHICHEEWRPELVLIYFYHEDLKIGANDDNPCCVLLMHYDIHFLE